MKLQCGLELESFQLQEGMPSGFNRYKSGKEHLFDRKSITLVTGRRDWAAFQVLLHAEEPYTISVGRRAVFSPYGPLINLRLALKVEGLEDASVSMRHVGLVEDDDGIWKADILHHDEVIHVKDQQVKSVWVELNIPELTRPGVYNGYVQIYEQSMFKDEVQIESLAVSVEVKDVIVPEAARYSFNLELWQHCSNIARKHEVELWSDAHFTVLEQYIASLGQLGQKVITIIASEIPWSGQGCFRVTNYYSDMFEYSIIGVSKNADGTFLYDFTKMERYISLCTKYHFTGSIDLFGLSNIWDYEPEGYGKPASDYPDAVRVRYLDQQDNCYKYMRTAEEIKVYIQALYRYFQGNGLLERVRIMADEPSDGDAFNKVMDIFTEIAPDFKFKACFNHMGLHTFSDKTSDMAFSALCTFEHSKELKSMKTEMDGKLLWYVACDIKYPNTFICSSLLESRLIPHLTAFMGFDGFLRWNYTAWPEDPRNRIRYKYPLFPAGDTNFVYPGHDGRPLLTLRYMNLKRGIQEYELAMLVKEHCSDAEERLADAWKMIMKSEDLKDIYSTSTSCSDWFSMEHADYESVRVKLLEALECPQGSK